METVVLLSKLKSSKSIEVKIELDEMDLTQAEGKATYEEIKQYIMENAGLAILAEKIVRKMAEKGLIDQWRAAQCCLALFLEYAIVMPVASV